MNLSNNGCFAVVVSYNRKALLQQCLNALVAQTVRPEKILVVDNASTDGTLEMLRQEGWLRQPGVELHPLSENSGGAGGFSAGLRFALDGGASWVWMMDDDAAPHPNALEELLRAVEREGDVYGSLAVSAGVPAWATTVLANPPYVAATATDVPSAAPVESLPFLGFLVNRSLVERIGLPDPGYFIAADDVEYCLRAQRAGARIIIAGRSHIEHPKADSYQARVLGRQVTCLRLAPWKRYYDTRNRILNARKYFGVRLITQTLPGIGLRLLAALWSEPRKLAQLGAAIAGLVDGMLGRKGRRHAKWGISQ